ncbi:hypothetical protein PVAG01_10463 [Phlyctema vagabunda]|uniref:Uncharacterized protein n=1 Tax=Phlyctema vagabunda TaxID=108571 RepID=A0ABR4P6F3_9HELO
MAQPSHNQPLLHRDENPEADGWIFETLNTYLAMGWAPQPTSGAGLLCGINALALGIRAQQALTAHGQGSDIPPEKRWSPERIATLMDTPEYDDHVFDDLQYQHDFNAAALATPAELREYARQAGYWATNQFYDFQLRIFLRMINADLGTHYSLGLIVRGYKSNNGRMGRTRVTIDAVDEMRNSGIIWLYNSREGDEEDGADHWEGLTPSPLNDAEHIATLDYLFRVVAGEPSQQVLRDEIEKRNYTIVKSFPEKDPQDIDVHRGCILSLPLSHMSDIVTPVPAGYEHRRTLDNSIHGPVLSARISKLPIKSNADSDYKDGILQITSNATERRQKKRKTTTELDTPKSQVEGPKRKQPQTDSEIKFRVFRVLHETSKICGPADQEAPLRTLEAEIEPSQKKPVTFHLDLKSYNENGGCHVRDLQGNIGYVQSRLLQRVLYRPWGLSTLPIEPLPSPPMSPPPREFDREAERNYYSKQLLVDIQREINDRNLMDSVVAKKSKAKTKIKKPVKADYIEALLNADQEFTHYLNEKFPRPKIVQKLDPQALAFLPMYRLKVQLDTTDQDDCKLRFYEGEIVMRIGDGVTDIVEQDINGKPVESEHLPRDLVIDYEGRYASIPRDYLEQIDEPWKLKVDSVRLDGILKGLRSTYMQRLSDIGQETEEAMQRKIGKIPIQPGTPKRSSSPPHVQTSGSKRKRPEADVDSKS